MFDVMVHLSTRLWVLQCVSFARLVAALVFACLAFQDVPRLILGTIYLFAMISDLVDGFLARKLNCQTFLGTIVDLISDKCLTVVSLLYAAEREIHLFPLSLIGVREIIVLGLRAIIVDGVPLLPTNRFFGGIMAAILWGNTLLLVFSVPGSHHFSVAQSIYTACAVSFLFNMYGDFM